MSLSLAELQQRFADSLRNPAATADGEFNSDIRREKIYRELIFNNISSLLSGTFPVLYATLEKTMWNQLIRQFLIEHRAQTPLFPELPAEFLQFLQHSQLPAATPDWLQELAHYEWIELALQLKTVIDIDSYRQSNSPQLSPLAICLSYHYPVNRINPDYQPDESEINTPTCLLVYRGYDYQAEQFNDAVDFLSISPAAARLLMLLGEGLGTTQLAQQLAIELQQPVGITETFAWEFLQDLFAKGIMFGVVQKSVQ